MSQLSIGPSLSSFSDVQEGDLISIRSYPYEVKGFTTEGYISYLLTSIFNGVVLITSWFVRIAPLWVLKVPHGSPLDFNGVDLLLRGNKGPTLGLQVKSSPRGYKEFLSHPSEFYKQLVVLWVNVQDRYSRLNLFNSLYPFLKTLGITLRPEVREVLVRRELFIKKGIKSLKVNRRGIIAGFKEEEINLLYSLGLCYRDGGYICL